MNPFYSDIKKANAALLYITKKLEAEKEADFLTVFKILYFADQKHLVKYGSPIIPDDYIAMPRGPVPSRIYDCLKDIKRGIKIVDECNEIHKSFEVYDNNYISAIAEPDMDELSPSEVKFLDESFEENHLLNFATLSQKSHDRAWKLAGTNCRMDILDIAEAGGANEDMLKLIQSRLDLSRISF